MSVANPDQYEDPNHVDAVTGVPESNSVPVLVITIHDPDVDTVTFVCNGTTYTGVTSSPTGDQFLLTAVGTGKSGVDQVCWTGKITVSGLSGFTRYTWTVSQSTYSNEGSFYNAPTATDDFRLLWSNCDVAAISSGYNGSEGFAGGAAAYNLQHPAFKWGIWPHYRALFEDSDVPVTLTIHCDDWGYYDRLVIDDSSGNTGFTHQFSPSEIAPPVSTGNRYHDYALAVLCCFGFCGTTTPANDDSRFLWGRQVDRAFMRRNTSFAFQWGDHEFKDNFGWDQATSADPTANPMHYTYTASVGNFDGGGKYIHDHFWNHIRPSLDNVVSQRDTDAEHWCIKYGALTIAAPDCVTNGSGGMHTYGATPGTGTVFGNNQIDDLREAIQTAASDFTLMCFPIGLRYIVNSASYPAGLLENNCGDQHTLYDHSQAEFQRLFTDTSLGGDESLMNSAQTNGATGNMFVFHGDYHHAHVYKYTKAAYTNNAREYFYMFGPGTTNGMSNMGVSAGLIDEANADISREYFPDWDYVSSDIDNAHNYCGLYAKVYGSKNTTRVDVHMIDESGAKVYSGKSFAGAGNEFHDIDKSMPNVSAAPVGEITMVTL